MYDNLLQLNFHLFFFDACILLGTTCYNTWYITNDGNNDSIQRCCHIIKIKKDLFSGMSRTASYIWKKLDRLIKQCAISRQKSSRRARNIETYLWSNIDKTPLRKTYLFLLQLLPFCQFQSRSQGEGLHVSSLTIYFSIMMRIIYEVSRKLVELDLMGLFRVHLTFQTKFQQKAFTKYDFLFLKKEPSGQIDKT